MIYDCFQFFNEIDLLEIRLNVLNDLVDRFVLVESTVTFSGEPKPLYYADHKDQFEKFNHKIIHVIVDDTPDVNPFLRDQFQKCAVKRGLANCNPSDIIIFSDVDEIPNPVELEKVIRKFDPTKIYHFAQRMFYYYLNNEEISGNLKSVTGEFDGVKTKKWLGTKVCSYGMLADRTTDDLRQPSAKEIGIRVDNGGWHFSYMGGDKSQSIEERVKHKIKSAAHQEFNKFWVLSKVKKNITKQRDLFGRSSSFVQASIDNSYPEYIQLNQNKYSHLILPEKKHRKFFW